MKGIQRTDCRRYFYNRDDKAKEELEKMMGCKFEDMTVEQRRLGCTTLSAFDGIWNKNKSDRL